VIDKAELEEVQAVYPGASAMSEGEKDYIFFPELKVRVGENEHCVSGLLLPSAHSSGYMTKLFLSSQIPGSALNWNFTDRILDRTWYSWSWQGVPASMRLLQILAGHLGAFK
jgi:hypothetical protein